MYIYCTVRRCAIATLLVFLRDTSSFNIEGNNIAVKYLPGVKDGTARNTGQNSLQSSFYGYGLSFTSQKELVISSPKMQRSSNSTQTGSIGTSVNNAKAEGSMAQCKISFANEDTCSNVQLQSPKPGDNFGLTVNNHQNRMMACSPSKVLQCTSTNSIPGFCYESRTGGKTWKSLKGRSPACPRPQQNLDIIFVLDGSYSVVQNFQDILKWTQNMASKFDIEKGINQIGVVQFSSLERQKDLNNQKFIKTEVRLGQHKRNRALKRSIGRIVRNGLTTYTAHAMNKTVLDFMKGSRWTDNDTQKVMVILTDGQATDSNQLPATANYVRSLGIIPFAVGVGNYDMDELRTIATGNVSSGQRVLSVDTFSGLESIVKDLSRQIMGVILEGSGNAKTASYKMEMAQTGFSMESTNVSKLMCGETVGNVFW